MQKLHNQGIYVQRIAKLVEEIRKARYYKSLPLKAAYMYDSLKPIPYEEALKGDYREIKCGEKWGDLWGSGWFRFRVDVPAEWQQEKLEALINIQGEGCVFVEGVPYQGLTDKGVMCHNANKEDLPVNGLIKDGKLEILVEAAANGLFGEEDGKEFHLAKAELVCVNEKAVKLFYDLFLLKDLLNHLEKRDVAYKKMLRRLNDICNFWNGGKGIDSCLQISGELLSKKAHASAQTAYSIGHGHLDLAWLWPVRETRRKGGRTFATALKLMDEYPEYKFGGSQPQLFQWIKEDYPGLYEKVKEKVKDKQFECQGAMWVEPDMNLTGGESLIRQCIYGKKFFQQEFGVEMKNLWLPDVFGYSAALPQILKKCGVDYFMTQKMDWSETNTFPCHTFYWKGIDGSDILTHLLPTKDYNCSNMPKIMREAEWRDRQSDVSDNFLNLYGIGDGGGGPSRFHIELGKRMEDLEGTPKFKFAFAEDFFEEINKIPKEELPDWSGELYLEFHRGTYTTQALMKKYNRRLEHELRDVEFLASFAAAADYPQKALEQIWKDTLLNQFHDILPGSSIRKVYDDAFALSENNLKKLSELENVMVEKAFGCKGRTERISEGEYLVYNSLSWPRMCQLVLDNDGACQYEISCGGKSVPYQQEEGRIVFSISVPSCGYQVFVVKKTDTGQNQISAAPEAKGFYDKENKLYVMENEFARYKIDGRDGTIISIFNKTARGGRGKELLAENGRANNFQLWEDKPHFWDAWDISNFYRETTPENGELKQVAWKVEKGLRSVLSLEFSLGNSTIRQELVLDNDSAVLKCKVVVDWQEKQKMLKVKADTCLNVPEAHFEIQYGMMARTTHNNTSWDQTQFETPAHRFAALTQKDHGLALMNDCKYGYYVKNQTLELTLLRSPQWPDPQADIGHQEFTFAYYPFSNSLQESDVLQKAHELNVPLKVFKAAGKIQPFYSAFEIAYLTPGSVKIEVVKPSFDGKGVVIRAYETMGSETDLLLKSGKEWQEVRETNMLEEEQGKLASTGGELELSFSAFEIKTFKLIY